jgi:hypothetical protein
MGTCEIIAAKISKDVLNETVPVGELDANNVKKLFEWVSYPNRGRTITITSCRFSENKVPELEIAIEDDTEDNEFAVTGETAADAISQLCDELEL